MQLLSDYQLKPGNELHEIIQETIKNTTFTGLGELSHLLVCASGSEGSKYISPDSRSLIVNQINEKIEALGGRRLILSIQEQLALCLPERSIDAMAAGKKMHETSENSNLTGVLKDMISGDVVIAN